MRQTLMTSTAVKVERKEQMPSILDYVKPGQTCHYFAIRNADAEVHVINKIIVMIDGIDVGGYGLRYETYAKMNDSEKTWARLHAKAYAFRASELRRQLHTGIIFPMLQKHLYLQAPGFPYNSMRVGA